MAWLAVDVSCFQAAFASGVGNELPTLRFISGCLNRFQAAHSLFARYLLDSLRARRYHAWAACLLGAWLLA